jgi:hypothetical protein
LLRNLKWIWAKLLHLLQLLLTELLHLLLMAQPLLHLLLMQKKHQLTKIKNN